MMLNPTLMAMLSIILCGPVWAINKCTAKDGRVMYQQQACDGDSKVQQLLTTPDARMAADNWSFSREKDSMTGEVTCFAVSPKSYLTWGFGSPYSAQVHLQLAVPVGGSSMLLTVRNWSSKKEIFHQKTEGQGIKVDDQLFIAIEHKYNQYAMGFSEGATPALIGQLQKGKTFRLRLRFWPYDDLLDTQPIPLTGFAGAALKAMKCAT